jgi:hypothetical protein
LRKRDGMKETGNGGREQRKQETGFTSS